LRLFQSETGKSGVPLTAFVVIAISEVQTDEVSSVSIRVNHI